jgi:sugar phosphate isomerase/epimerase
VINSGDGLQRLAPAGKIGQVPSAGRGAVVELMNLFTSNSGIVPGEGEISRFPFEERVKSLAKAGFVGMSFWHTDLAKVMETIPLRDIKAMLDDNGLSVFEIEFIEDWFVDGARKAASDERKRFLFDVHAALGSHHIKVGDFRNTPTTMPRLIDAFGELCEEAAEIGAVVGFEFMRSAMIHTLEESLAMVEGASAPNGGLIVDIAHTMALGISNEAVGRIPARHLVSVELNDNVLPSTPGYDPAARRYCGEGEFDVAGFIAAARTAGYDGPWAVEVFNRAYAGRSLRELDGTAWRTTLPYFS